MVYCNGFLSDWETYFEEVHRFISSLGGGRMSFANELYTEFVLERLGNCVRSLTTLLEYVQPVYALDMYNSEYEIISAYHQQLSELLEIYRLSGRHTSTTCHPEVKLHFNWNMIDQVTKHVAGRGINTTYTHLLHMPVEMAKC